MTESCFFCEEKQKERAERIEENKKKCYNTDKKKRGVLCSSCKNREEP